MKCLSICRSIHARCTTEKYGDLFSSRFSIYTRKWETTRGLPNIRHSAIFFIFVFSMHESIGGVLYRSRLCIRRASTFVDMIFLFIRARMRIRKNISRFFILTHDAGSQ